MISRLFWSLLMTFICVTAVSAQQKRTQAKKQPGQSYRIQLAKELLNDNPMALETYGSINNIARRLSIQRFDIAGSRNPAYVVTGIHCGNVNCPIFLFRTEGRRYIQIPIDDDASGVPSVLESQKNGFRDIKVHIHGGADGFQEVVYRFSGRVYKPEICEEWSNGYTNSRGYFVRYPKPKLTSRKRC